MEITLLSNPLTLCLHSLQLVDLLKSLRALIAAPLYLDIQGILAGTLSGRSRTDFATALVGVRNHLVLKLFRAPYPCWH